ncbi:MAG TPA: DUF3471 domain-containing protein, partial [Thermoanaerobaculia bacterium]|nr:DUF3471 domain-containing protein [Thermoanaerobaculia bacterium]
TLDHKDGWGDSYGHEGGTGGYRSQIEVWPANGRAVVVLASNAAALPSAWLAVWRGSGQERIARHEVELPLATLADYVGVYSFDKEQRFTILRRGDGLVARLTGQPFVLIFPSARDEFFYKVVDAQLSFHRDAAGAVDRLTLHQNGRDLPATRDSSPAPRIEFPNAAALAGYAGEYDFGEFQPGAKITVTARADTLFVMLTGQQALPVFCVARDKFEYDAVAAAVTFERNEAGKVVAVTLHQNGMDMRAPRT